MTGADRMEFGSFQILTPNRNTFVFRYADETLYAIGMYLMSLDPPQESQSGIR